MLLAGIICSFLTLSVAATIDQKNSGDPFSIVPSNATLKPRPFKANAPEQALQEMKVLLKYGKVGPVTYENIKGGDYGISREWLINTKNYWLTKHNWRKAEARLNSFPNFIAPIEHEGDSYDVHFIALFSKKPGAVPITLLHGWPGSVLEFLPTLDLLRKKYRPETLPYHIIVPSIPGYAYSTGPPLRTDRDFKIEAGSAIIDKLMVGLGFGNGYVAQGGDVGSFIARILGVTSKSCKAVHLNLVVAPKPDDIPLEELTQQERDGLARGEKFSLIGGSYARQQGNRPSTTGLILSSNPLALLSWVGEKFLDWVDAPLSVDEILDSVTLYWLTDTYPRSIPFYRQLFGPVPSNFYHPDPAYRLEIPTGYSYFPKEISPIPVKWASKNANIVWSKIHTKGGHFAALEVPTDFLQDVEEFVAKVWPTTK